MKKALWATLGGIAVLWPGRLAGPLDGAPLDQPIEAAIIGVLLVWVVLTNSAILTRTSTKLLVVALLVWKAATGALLTQDGWCLRFTSPVSLYREGVVVPHTWDIRADWRSTVPQCSAVMTTGYDSFGQFPLWFYNLPPEDMGRQAIPEERPPFVTLAFTLDGYLDAPTAGLFQVPMGEDVDAAVLVDDRLISKADAVKGATLESGLHRVSVRGTLTKNTWSLTPLWNGRTVWRQAPATLSPPTALDRGMRPWGRAAPPMLIVAFLGTALLAIVRRAGSPVAGAFATVVALILTLVGLSGRESFMRLAPLLILGAIALPVSRRLRNLFGASLLVGLPFLAMVVAIGWGQVGLFTWYSSGDDWWMFQRWAYRIFMQGYWLEGGQRTFWFQPLYRWIAGSLHMVFGDSSVGELFWDAGASLMCALYAFQVARVFAGFRWGLLAATTTLALFTMGPAWYLLGRGLSEFSSAGLICGAALFALRARHGSWPAAIAAGVLATLGVFARLNNLPMGLAVAIFALPIRQPIGDLFHPARWWARLSRPALLGVLGFIALGLWLFTARTWYYTGVPSMFWGTTAALNSVWQTSDTPLQAAARIGSSVMMLLTMNDPPRFDIRAVPVLAGFVIAVLAAAQVRGFRRLPLNAVVFCLAGIVGALVARGSAYPGRFSIHLVPVTVVVMVCALAQAVDRRSRARRATP